MAAQHPRGGRSSDAVRGVLEPVVQRLALVLEDVLVQPAGSRRLLRVVLDRDTGAPLSLDDVAEASREVSTALDESDVMGGTAYVLEVTTPGVDRPLSEPRHFTRNTRRLVQVTLGDGSSVEGRITSAAQALVLTVAGPKKGVDATREIAWPDVVRGKVQVEFTAPPEVDDATDDGDDVDADDHIGEPEDED